MGALSHAGALAQATLHLGTEAIGACSLQPNPHSGFKSFRF